MPGRRRASTTPDWCGRGRHDQGRARPGRRRQRQKPFNLPVDRLGQREGIELIPERDPRRDRRRIGRRARLEALERSARRFVPAPAPGPDALLAQELDGGQEEILEQPELVAVEGVQRRHRRRGVVAEIPHELPHVGPVLLLDVGVVVLLVGRAARELDLVRLAVPEEMVIDELGPVEFCATTGNHRKSALRLLHGPPPGRARPRRRRRAATYGTPVIQALTAIWEAAGYPWSVRLKALLPLWLPWARRRRRLSPTVCRQLRTISARQIDRRLAPAKRTLKTRRYGRTKPGTLLKPHIPLKTDHWNVTVPGFTELDRVAPAAARADGEFGHSLNVTDIHTTWGETRAILGRGEARVQAALDEIRQALPFRLQGIDSDNGSEFINDHLYRYCQA